jgi:hypothetical protein
MAKSPKRLMVPVGQTAEQTAEACLLVLSNHYGVKIAKSALREAIIYLPAQPGGRRPDRAVAEADAVFLRHHRALIRKGMSRSQASAAVAARFCGPEDPARRGRTADTIKRRLRQLAPKGIG